jgi:hypothetical protein
MNDSPPDNAPSRDTFLAVLLLIVIGVPLFVFFNIATGGLFILLLVLVAGVAVLGVFNYFLWGHSLTEETAGEREEEELREIMAAEDPPYRNPQFHRRLSSHEEN